MRSTFWRIFRRRDVKNKLNVEFCQLSKMDAFLCWRQKKSQLPNFFLLANETAPERTTLKLLINYLILGFRRRSHPWIRYVQVLGSSLKQCCLRWHNLFILAQDQPFSALIYYQDWTFITKRWNYSNSKLQNLLRLLSRIWNKLYLILLVLSLLEI